DIGSPKLHGHMYPRLCPTRAQQRPTAVLPWASLPPQPFTGLVHTHRRSLAVGGFLFIPYAGSRNLFRPILALLPVLGLEPIGYCRMVSDEGEQVVRRGPVGIVSEKRTPQRGPLNVLAFPRKRAHIRQALHSREKVVKADPEISPEVRPERVTLIND